MKKLLGAVIGLTLLAGVFALPAVSNAVSSTSTAQDLLATLEAQIATLKAQLATLNAQIEALNKTKGEVKETIKDIKSTLQLARHLREGMSGDDVRTLQELLATDRDIYPEGLITGYFGKLTAKAVRRFQSLTCISQVGQVGPQTMRRINELLDEGAGKSYGGEGGHVPKGLLTAPGIQKKLCGTNATTTPDVVAPVISNVIATGTTATATQIKWKTNEKANGTVWYGTVNPVVTATPTLMVSSANFVKEHNLSLTGLTATTTYYYVVISADVSGNTATATQQSFMTLGN